MFPCSQEGGLQLVVIVGMVVGFVKHVRHVEQTAGTEILDFVPREVLPVGGGGEKIEYFQSRLAVRILQQAKHISM
jgi:hypothetical protein